MSLKQSGSIGFTAVCLFLGSCSGNERASRYELPTQVTDSSPAVIDRDRTDRPKVDGTELITNGGFETGDLTGWSVLDIGDSGTWVTFDEFFIPQSGIPVEPPPEGNFGAITDMIGPGEHYLFQDITLGDGSATLRFVDKLDNLAGDYDPELQVYRVDIVEPGEPGQETVLANLFQTQPGDPPNTPYTTREFDISEFAGQTIRIRFSEVDNLFFFNIAIDDVSVVQDGGGGGGGDLACELAIEGVPNPASVGAPFVLSMDFANLGGSFAATVGVLLIADGEVTSVRNDYGVPIAEDFSVAGFPMFSTLTLDPLPPSVGFLVTVFDEETRALVCSNVTVVGVGAAASAGDTADIERLAEEHLRTAGRTESNAQSHKRTPTLNGNFSLPFGN